MNRSLLEHRIIFIDQSIQPSMTSDIISGLLELNAKNNKEAIDIYINSPGGSVANGLAIIDTMKTIYAPIRTICIGVAYSMAAWLLAAGDRGQRFITEHSEVMIHQANTEISGNTDQVVLYSNRLKNKENDMASLLSQWTSKDMQTILNDIKVDYFMNAEQTIHYGIADHILKNTKKP
jgi:ATP-dependent Clp protease, protease subunit